MKNRESPWNAFPNYIFNTLEGIDSWNNKDIFKNKSLFNHIWFWTGEFAIVFDAIPKSVMLLLKNCNSEEISMVNFHG